MTYIQPARKSALNKVLFAIVAIAVLAAFAVVVLHNNIVNLEYGILSMRRDLKAVQTKNVELEEKIFKLLDAGRLAGASGRNLTEDKNPEYLEVGRAASEGGLAASGISRL